MTQRPDRKNFSLGASAEIRLAALNLLATEVNAIGRNGAPSVSELISRIADAADYDLARTGYLISEILVIAAESHVLAAEEAQLDL